MEKLKNYGISLLWELGVLLGISLVVTLLYHHDIVNATIVNWSKILLPLIVAFIGGWVVGKRAPKKGYLEGIISGIILVFLFFLFSFLASCDSIKLRTIIYYIILIATSMFASMIGINRKKEK